MCNLLFIIYIKLHKNIIFEWFENVILNYILKIFII